LLDQPRVDRRVEELVVDRVVELAVHVVVGLVTSAELKVVGSPPAARRLS